MRLEVTNRDPAAERFNAALASGIFVLIGMAFGFVAAGLMASTSSPIGWLIITLITLLGLAPLARWFHDRRRPNRIVLWGLDPTASRQLAVGVAALNRIDEARRWVAPGPAADHLDFVYETALDHVRAIETALRGHPLGQSFPEVAAIVCQIADLADASAELARASLPDGSMRLSELSERTRLFASALEENDDRLV